MRFLRLLAATIGLQKLARPADVSSVLVTHGGLASGLVCLTNTQKRNMQTNLTMPRAWRTPQPPPLYRFAGSGATAPRLEPDSTLSLRKPATCPECGATDIRLILYGRPNAEALDLIWRGEACLGYRSIDRWLPDWRCHGCGHEWFDADDPAKQNLERLVERVLGPAEGRKTLAA